MNEELPPKRPMSEKKRAHIALGNIKEGISGLTPDSWLKRHFGDLASQYKFPGCSHDTRDHERFGGKTPHANGICSDKVKFFKALYEAGMNHTKLLQVDELVKLRVIEDTLIKKYFDTGLLDPEFVKISKNLITLTDKMRRQDEGIKVNQELTVGVDEFRELVEAQAAVTKKEIHLIPVPMPIESQKEDV